jgi:hypothetical protein
VADARILAVTGNATRITGDTVIETYTGWAQTKIWNGTAWAAAGQTIDGSLLVTGTMYADKKCCKDKASCKKEATATKGCSQDGATAGKSCCKKGTAAVAPAASEDMAMAPCCKKSIAAGGKACCAKDAHVAPKPAATPVRDDQK